MLKSVVFSVLTMLVFSCGVVDELQHEEVLLQHVEVAQRIIAAEQVKRSKATDGGGEILLSGLGSDTHVHNTKGASYQLTVASADSIKLIGEMFVAILLPTGRVKQDQHLTTESVLSLYGARGKIEEQNSLAQWKTSGNIFSATQEINRTSTFAQLFFLQSALANKITSIAGTINDKPTTVYNLHVAYDARITSVLVSSSKSGRGTTLLIEEALREEYTEGNRIKVNAIAVDTQGNINTHAQKRATVSMLTDSGYYSLLLEDFTCTVDDVVLLRFGETSQQVYQSTCGNSTTN